MEYQCWRVYLAEKIEHVNGCTCFEKSGGDLGRSSLSTELIEPADLFVGGAGNEARSEYLAKRGVVLAPTETREIDESAIQMLFIWIASLIRSARVSALELQS